MNVRDHRDIIPVPIPEPRSTPVENVDSHPRVIFTMEATGFYRRNPEVADDILHIGAVKDAPLENIPDDVKDTGNGICEDNVTFFSKFLESEKTDFSMDKAAQTSFIRFDDDGGIHVGSNEDVVAERLSTREALEKFCHFLGYVPVVLYGHNIKSNGCHILYHAANECGMFETLSQKIRGFVDTRYLMNRSWEDKHSELQLNAKALSAGREDRVDANSLENLRNFILREHPDNSDALDKVKALKRILDIAFESRRYAQKDTADCSFTFEYIKQRREYNMGIEQRMPSWQPLVDMGVLSKPMAEKAAGSGLLFDHLVAAFQRDEQLVGLALSELTDEQVRVTGSQAIIGRIIAYIREQQ